MGAPSGEHPRPDQADDRGNDGGLSARDQRTSQNTVSSGGARTPSRGPHQSSTHQSSPQPSPESSSRTQLHQGADAHQSASKQPSYPHTSKRRRGRRNQRYLGEVYGALDLGTNNCRLLLARPSRRGFKVVDAFSRIIRLGEGLSQSGELSEPAMVRTIDALKVCARKLNRHRVKRARFIATEACRIARNSDEFLTRAREHAGLDIEVLTPEAEAGLAVQGCTSLIDARVRYVLVFDIGGGSSELIWLDLAKRGPEIQGTHIERKEAPTIMDSWTSLPVGVVTLAEKFGGRDVTEASFEAMIAYVTDLIAPFEAKHHYKARIADAPAHLLGTSGTVTTVAGIKLNLPRYDRARVDGVWLNADEAHDVTYTLLRQSYQERVRQPCIGTDRADLVLAGCAILEAVMRMWPCDRLRVADRGLREGILATLMSEDGVYRSGRRRRSGRGPTSG